MNENQEKYIAHQGERLDSVVYAHYRTLDVFALVLSANPKLSPLLKDGDVVILPSFPIFPKKEKTLW